MKKGLFFTVVLLLFSFAYANGNPLSNNKEEIRKEADELLLEWVNTLLSYQINHENPSLDGGLLCPACGRIHGRCGDAVLPLMYIAQKTNDTKYIDAAKRLMKWMENVHIHDGSWKNDINVSDWNGTTVFAAIALYEALHHHGHLLDDSTRNAWRNQLLPAGEFIYNSKVIFSRRREGMRNQNVNYSASATYILHVLGKEFGRQDFMDEARQIAGDLKAFFTENEYFLFGEGPNIYNKTKNGCWPVDLLYNVEESLPHMAYYAQMTEDSELLQIIEKSMSTHLEFMLPDGAWDNSWGTRSFKWMYWGGRTSDGFMGGYAALGNKHPEYMEAIRRNVSLLKRATHKGLLHGMHYYESGVEACIHHTFGHSKALASFLNQPPVNSTKSQLPRDHTYGVKYFKDLNTWLVSEGDWRATVTGYDAEYKVKGTHPMGGALSVLWHQKTGPLFAATMNKYTLIEAPNMQEDTQKYQMSGTPRVELYDKGVMYSNLDDLDTQISYVQQKDGHQFLVNTHLVNSEQQAPGAGLEGVGIQYLFQGNEMIIRCDIPQSLQKVGARLMLPIIATPQQKEELTGNNLKIKCNNAEINLQSQTPITIAPSNSGRIFNPVPGFSFIPVAVYPDAEGRVEVRIHIN